MIVACVVAVAENGVIGRPLDSPSALFTAEDSDPGDSILAAEVAAARALLGQLDGLNVEPRADHARLAHGLSVEQREELRALAARELRH